MDEGHYYYQPHFRRFLSIFLPVLVIVAVLSWSIYYIHHVKTQEDILKAQEKNLLVMQQKLVSLVIKTTISDLHIIASNKALKELVEHLDNTASTLTYDFLAFSKYKGIYDQVRVLDSTGMEVVRVDLKGEQPYLVPNSQLQFKGDRYYFEDTFRLEEGEIFMSPFDLNIERGEIEKPLKPMIRFGTPLFNSQGDKTGILIVNYLGKKIIDALEDFSSELPGRLLLLNKDGYWLKGLTPENEWGFMLKERHEAKFSNSYPELWQKMVHDEKGQVLTSDGLYTFIKIYPLQTDIELTSNISSSSQRGVKNDYFWMIVSYISPQEIYKNGELFVFILVLSDLVFLVIFGVVSWRLVLANEKRRLAEKELRLMNVGLEEKVRNRTQELLDANKILKDEISERMKAIEEKAKIESQLRQAQKMEAIGTLARGIAHDFNNILTPILGYSELLAEEVDKDSPLAPQIEQIFTSTQRARELVRQILTFSRHSEHKMAPLQVQFLIKEVLQLLRATLPKTIEIQTDLDSDVSSVLADPTQIHQIVMNLCTNAYHAMRDKDGGTLSISLKEVQLDSQDLGSDNEIIPGTYVKLKVQDTGTGISPQIQNKIYEPYFTTKNKEEGTGLGLAVIHGIVQTLKGYITFDSEPGKGTTFRILIPSINENHQIERDKIHRQDNKLNGSEKILVVDDEEQIVLLEKTYLEKFGYDITIASSAERALEMFRQAPQAYDLVITDMTMPSMTGIKLVRKLKQIRSDILTIVCTGFGGYLNAKKVKELGIDGYISKPVSSSDFVKTVRKILDNK